MDHCSSKPTYDGSLEAALSQELREDVSFGQAQVLHDTFPHILQFNGQGEEGQDLPWNHPLQTLCQAVVGLGKSPSPIPGGVQATQQKILRLLFDTLGTFGTVVFENDTTPLRSPEIPHWLVVPHQKKDAHGYEVFHVDNPDSVMVLNHPQAVCEEAYGSDPSQTEDREERIQRPGATAWAKPESYIRHLLGRVDQVLADEAHRSLLEDSLQAFLDQDPLPQIQLEGMVSSLFTSPACLTDKETQRALDSHNLVHIIKHCCRTEVLKAIGPKDVPHAQETLWHNTRTTVLHSGLATFHKRVPYPELTGEGILRAVRFG